MSRLNALNSNALAESHTSTLLQNIRSMLRDAHLSAKFRGLAGLHASRLECERIHAVNEDLTLYNFSTGRKPHTSRIQQFGCLVLLHESNKSVSQPFQEEEV